MQGKRVDRVGHLMQMELSRTILTKVKDPRLGFVTVTHVDVSPDLRSACVFYSCMGDSEAKNKSQVALEKSAGFLQREIGTVLNLRYTPKLIFRLDETIDRGLQIDDILDEIHKDDPVSEDDDAPGGERE